MTKNQVREIGPLKWGSKKKTPYSEKASFIPRKK